MKKELKLVVLGGGSAYTPALVENLIEKEFELNIKELWLVDVIEQKNNLKIIHQFLERLIEYHELNIRLYSSFDQREALNNADFVIFQVNVGVNETELEDERICYENQLYASEVFGVKSVFKALRTVPVIYDVIDDMNDVCENAWLINISQPMGLISEAVLRYADFDKYIGISHVSFKINECFARSLKVKPEQLILNVAGISPTSFITNVFKKQKSGFEDVMDAIQKQESACFWSKDFLKDLGVYPNHDLKYIYNQKDMAIQFGIDYENEKSKGFLDLAMKEQLYEMYKKQSIDDCLTTLMAKEGVESSKKAISLINSIVKDKRDYQIVNTINNGHIKDLPEGSAIEITARITKDGPMPVHISRLPNQVKGLLQHIKSFEELLADAIFDKNLDKAELALKTHPLMYSNEEVTICFKAFLNANEKYLKYYQN